MLRNDCKHYAGVATAQGREAVIGRVCFFDSYIMEKNEACILYLHKRESFLALCARISVESTVGIVLTPDAIYGDLLDFIALSKSPYIILGEGICLENECNGRIALLDVSRGALTVNPDMDAIDIYMRKKERSARRLDLLKRSMIIDKGRCCEDLRNISLADCDGIYYDAALISRLGDPFDVFAEIAEENCGLPITVCFKVPQNEREEEALGGLADALFRAAVYGDFSIALGGFLTEKELLSAYSVIHSTFCRLEGDGREFNGYIPKGVIIEAPLWLARPLPLTRPDFICFDFDGLATRLLGCSAERIQDDPLIIKTLLGVWEKYLSCYAPRSEFRCKSNALFKSEIFGDWCERMKIAEIYLPQGFFE